MKIAVVGRNKEKLQKHIYTIRKYRAYLSKKPDVVVAIGGDGTFLAAERQFPGVPKLMIREQSICVKCDWDNVEEGLKRIISGRYRIEEFHKVTARLNGFAVEAVNDIVVRNITPTYAIRFKIKVNGKWLPDEFIGDGVVVSTAFGSEGYFRSIVHEHFEKGIGIAFNNTTRKYRPIVLAEDAVVEVKLIRGSAHVVADNYPKLFVLPEGKSVVVKKSGKKARVVRLR